MSILSEKSYFTYSTIPQNDLNVESGYKTAFDYKSIFSYDSPFKDKEVKTENSAGEKTSEEISVEGLSGKIISVLAMVFSYLFIFFTLPISVWFCFKNLAQWERIVIYRLGKLIGVKGPGNVFLIPWLDCSTKLDLRTQVICHPLKQVLL
jgi:erythrocyte band 7 integral membrane protein